MTWLRTSTTFIFLLFVGLSVLKSQECIINLNDNWQFSHKDDPDYSDHAMETAESKQVTIPHDWSFQEGISRNGMQNVSGGYYNGGVAWYQRVIKAPKSWKQKNVYLEFDGVYMNSEVWVNGQAMGKRPYGYISFRYNIADFLKEGDNLIAVRVDNSLEPSARWYHPCGIYAPVHLRVCSQNHILPHGIYFTSTELNQNAVLLQVETTLGLMGKNSGKLFVEIELQDKTGKVLAQHTLPIPKSASDTFRITKQFQLQSPVLWDTQNPYLYTLTTKLNDKKNSVDEVKMQVGIRKAEWSTEKGFILNGKVTKLLGVCEHWEGGPVGGAWTKPLLRWKLGLLKDMGVNAIRTAHNPCPPFFYDLCDEMGLLVMDEIFDGWKKKASEDYGKQAFKEWWQADLSEWVLRDRNHPSVIIYSLGNETQHPVGEELVALCHRLDSTRLVSSGHSGSEFMDVLGVNGHSEKMKFYDEERPQKPFVATEAPHTWQTRGYYRTKTWFRDGYPNKGQSPFPLPDLTEEEVFLYEWASPEKWSNHKQHFNSSYDNAMVRISARKNWELMRDLPWYSGHFRWTGFDYYGEAGYVHGGWPFRLFMGGALDVAGFKKDLYYFYQSQWTVEPMVHILPHWTHPDIQSGTLIPVWVYSNADEVELFLNGKSLGKDKLGVKWDEMQCEWMVHYEPGTLSAKAYRNGKLVAETNHITSGTPSGINLFLDDKYVNPDSDNTAIVTAQITDNADVFYPYGENALHYYLSGPAHIVSLENGDPVDTTRQFGLTEKRAFMGMSNAFIELNKGQEPVELIVGGIIGEKQLRHSNTVSISVKSTSLRGNSRCTPLKIFYTIDGSQATTASTLYTEPFSIELGTTVKAIVLKNADVILVMEEQFQKNVGLFWGSSGDFNTGNARGMIAANGTIEGGKIGNFNGKKIVDFKNSEGSIIWYQENDGSEGNYELTIWYSCQNEPNNIPMALYVNEKKTSTLVFDSINKKNQYWQRLQTTIPLSAGANYIELKTVGQGGPKLLMINVD